MLVHMSLESRVRKSREGLVGVELSGVERKMIVGVVYVNPEEMGVRETERMFEVLLVDVKYEEKGFDVIVMGDFNARIGLGAEEYPNSNGKRLLELVRTGDFSIGNQLLSCGGRWTWNVV